MSKDVIWKRYKQIIYEHTLPYALSIGMTRREFMKSKPIELVSYGLAYKMQKKKKDEEMWLQGFYVYKAFETVMAHFSAGLSGKKCKAEYPQEPFSFAKQSNDKDIQKQRELFVAGLMAMQSNFELEKKSKERESGEN